MSQIVTPKDMKIIELRDALDYEHETLTHNLLMEDPALGKAAAVVRAMSLILRKEREQDYQDLLG